VSAQHCSNHDDSYDDESTADDFIAIATAHWTTTIDTDKHGHGGVLI
jgi:hypothetical protein